MNLDLPSSESILEELADKAREQIDRFSPVGFDAALDELCRYHRFLLLSSATVDQEGKPFSFSSVSGFWNSQNTEWIRSYRGLFERASDRIPDTSQFINKLAYVGRRLLPNESESIFSDDVLISILDLSLVLIYRLEAWVTKRKLGEVGKSGLASADYRLAGSDAKAYANTLPEVISAWESLLNSAPFIFRWDECDEAQAQFRWNVLCRSWPYLWHHLKSTSQMFSAAIWNGDEIGAEFFQDCLSRWPTAFSHILNDRGLLLPRRQIFPDIFSMNFSDAIQTIKGFLPDHLSAPSPDELFYAVIQGVHEDIVVLTAALHLDWSMSGKLASQLVVKYSISLLDRQVTSSSYIDENMETRFSFSSLTLSLLRLEFADDRYKSGTYGADLSWFVARSDGITEHNVVPGRIFRPTTLNGIDDLRAAFVVLMLSRQQEGDEVLERRVRDISTNTANLPNNDQHLLNALHALVNMKKLLDGPLEPLRIGYNLLAEYATFEQRVAQVQLTLSSLIASIEEARTKALRDRKVDETSITNLEELLDSSLLENLSGLDYFRDFKIVKSAEAPETDPKIKVTITGLSKDRFIDANTDWKVNPLGSEFKKSIKGSADHFIWRNFVTRPRLLKVVSNTIEDPAFWETLGPLATEVGAEPILLISSYAEGLALRQLVFQVREAPRGLKFERKMNSDLGKTYITTVDGVDVHSSNLPATKAYLFSPYILQTLAYRLIDGGPYVCRVFFQSEDQLKGNILLEYHQTPQWADWPIYELTFKSAKN